MPGSSVFVVSDLPQSKENPAFLCEGGRAFGSACSEPEFIAVLVLTGTQVGKAESREGQEDPTPLIQL